MVLQKQAPDVRVFVAGREQQNVHCLVAILSSGASLLPRAILELQPPGRRPGRRELKDMNPTRFNQAEVEVVVNGMVVHWGKALAQPVTMDGQRGDHLQLISRMEQHHFGEPLFVTYFWDRRTREAERHTLPTIFNPDFDGVTVGNRSGRRDRTSGSGLFVHEEQLQSAAARRYHESPTPRFWTLPEAVNYLCWALNGSQRHILNPTLAHLEAVLPDDTSLLRNHEAPVNEYLPQQLDRLLNPFGFHWTVDFEARGRRRIRIFKRAGGRRRSLAMQSPGSNLDMNRTNVESLSLTADVSTKAFNAVRVYGEYTQHEVTVELFKAWSRDDDDTADDLLDKNSEEWLATPKYQNIWRKWVLNEAGDYNRVRPEITDPYPLDAIFHPAPYVQHRRRFEPCISLNEDLSPKGHSAGVFIEYWNPPHSDGSGNPVAGEWLPLDYIAAESRAVRILDKECGIYFDGNTVPIEIRRHGTAAKVRVTATIRSDARAEVRLVAARTLLSDFKEEFLDVGTKFKVRKRHSTSRFRGSVTTTSERDDTLAMTEFARQLLSAWNIASIDGTVTVTGVDHDLRLSIGSTIDGITSRMVSFNVSPDSNLFPSVISAKLDFVNQKTDFTLDTFRDAELSAGHFGAHSKVRREF